MADSPSPDPGGSHAREGPESVTLAEVAHLWWFADGAIMNIDTRQGLRRSWGLCSVHSWLYFRFECELRYQPLGNAVLMQDLVERAATELRGAYGGRRARAAARSLRRTDGCPTCEHATASSRTRAAFARDRDRLVAGSRTQHWLSASEPIWGRRICAHCQPVCRAARPIPCREHVVEENGIVDLSELAGYLAQLDYRLRACVRSMTADGPARTADSDAALVEALGWTAGWAGLSNIRSVGESR